MHALIQITSLLCSCAANLSILCQNNDSSRKQTRTLKNTKRAPYVRCRVTRLNCFYDRARASFVSPGHLCVQVVQLYIRWQNASVPVPSIQLSGFERRTVRAGKREVFRFQLTPETFQVWALDNSGFTVESGKVSMIVRGFAH